MGVKDPGIDFAKLKEKERYEAFSGAVENHYRYYQYYSNTLVAIVAAFIFDIALGGFRPSIPMYLAGGATALVLFFASKDTLTKYFARANAILK
jgi:hypothetical protein